MPKLEELSVQYITNESGERTAVILPLEEFQELLNDMEDLASLNGAVSPRFRTGILSLN